MPAADSITCTFDTERFNRDLEQIAIRTKRPLPYVLNKKLMYIIARARDMTPLANRASVQSALNVMQTEKVNKKGVTVRKTDYSKIVRSKAIGAIKQPLNYIAKKYRKRQNFNNPFALYQARRKKLGQAPLTPNVPAENIKRFISNRLRAIGTARSGWKAALGKLAAAVHSMPTGESHGVAVKQTGQAIPAVEGWNPIAEAHYRITVASRDNPHIDPRTEAALEKAFAMEMIDMEAFLARELEKELSK